MKSLLVAFAFASLTYAQNPQCELTTACGGGPPPGTQNCSVQDSRNSETLGSPSCGVAPSAFQISWEWTIWTVNTSTGTSYGTPVATWITGNGWCQGLRQDCYNPSNLEDTPYMFGISTLNNTTHNWTFQGQVYNELPNGISGTDGFSCAGVSITFSPPITQPALNCAGSPIVIDTGGEGFHLTSATNGVWFRDRDESPKTRMGWTDQHYHNGWLAHPRNGQVISLADLFGNFSPQPPSKNQNGYKALAYFASQHGCGTTNEPLEYISRDNCLAAWDLLRVWIDANHDGISQSEELHTLDSLGVKRLSLSFSESRWIDEYGNQFRYKSSIEDRDAPKDKRTYDVFLVTR